MSDKNDINQINHFPVLPEEAAALEDAVRRSQDNMGEATDLWHPDHGYLIKDGNVTVQGHRFFSPYKSTRKPLYSLKSLLIFTAGWFIGYVMAILVAMHALNSGVLK